MRVGHGGDEIMGFKLRILQYRLIFDFLYKVLNIDILIFYQAVLITKFCVIFFKNVIFAYQFKATLHKKIPIANSFVINRKNR